MKVWSIYISSLFTSGVGFWWVTITDQTAVQSVASTDWTAVWSEMTTHQNPTPDVNSKNLFTNHCNNRWDITKPVLYLPNDSLRLFPVRQCRFVFTCVIISFVLAAPYAMYWFHIPCWAREAVDPDNWNGSEKFLKNMEICSCHSEICRCWICY